MAAIAGIKGSIAWVAQGSDLVSGGAHALQANKWSGSIDRDIHDVTPFAPTSNARVKIPGLHSMSGTIEGFLDDTTAHDVSIFTADPQAVSGAITLTATTNRTYSADALLSNWSVVVDAQGVNTFSCSFETTGVIATA